MLKNQQIQAVLANLGALGLRQKIALGLLGVVLTAGTLVFTYLLNSPATAVVYTAIPREELSRMSRILSENGLAFAIDLDRGSVSVAPHLIEEARLVLADHGLPSGSDAGYELFDKVNSLGLTSFMQEVTKTRATEGELARTIQMIKGIKAARVHLVLPEDRGFRSRAAEGPTASVVVSGNGPIAPSTANAIRHLVAGGVRGLAAENVTVLRSDGTLIASSDDKIGAGSLRLAELEAMYERELADKINSALGSHLGEENYRVSVTAKLNSDQRRTDETTFFPDSRVERSVRVVREQGTSENSESSTPTTVAENIPTETAATTSGQSTRENNEKRDEVTNYEISQRRVSTVSEGYQIERLAVALVVNRQRVATLLPADADQAAFDAKLGELRQTIQAAVGFSQERGDLIEVTALEFLPQEPTAAETSAGAVRQFMTRHFSAMLNALAGIVGVLILALLVVRPVLAFLSREPRAAQRGGEETGEGRAAVAGSAAVTGSAGATSDPALIGVEPRGNLQLAGGPGHSHATGEPYALDRHDHAVNQIANLIDQSEERAAFVVRDWLASGAQPS
ncbi:MAG: flagellar M-ring protein [Alphaproteobacteria bacterium]|nr:MAG: flagellar M-ring protein [Alphaproteobacteria bacterium]